jgi:hypothetical protein
MEWNAMDYMKSDNDNEEEEPVGKDTVPLTIRSILVVLFSLRSYIFTIHSSF